MDIPPPAIIEIVTIEKRDIRAEVLEHVARLLCRQAGENPDADVRQVGNNFQTVHLPYPSNLTWTKYREPAEKLLLDLFGARH